MGFYNGELSAEIIRMARLLTRFIEHSEEGRKEQQPFVVTSDKLGRTFKNIRKSLYFKSDLSYIKIPLKEAVVVKKIEGDSMIEKMKCWVAIYERTSFPNVYNFVRIENF